jgi:hypothetical protein
MKSRDMDLRPHIAVCRSNLKSEPQRVWIQQPSNVQMRGRTNDWFANQTLPSPFPPAGLHPYLVSLTVQFSSKNLFNLYWAYSGSLT